MYHKKGNKSFHGWKASKNFHYIHENKKGIGQTKETGICPKCNKLQTGETR